MPWRCSFSVWIGSYHGLRQQTHLPQLRPGALKSERGVRIGRTIKCLNCAAAFTARPEDAERTAVNAVRLVFVLLAALLFLLGGAALACYCFAPNAQKQSVQIEPLPAAVVTLPSEDEAELPPPIPGPRRRRGFPSNSSGRSMPPSSTAFGIFGITRGETGRLTYPRMGFPRAWRPYPL